MKIEIKIKDDNNGHRNKHEDEREMKITNK